MAQTGWRLPSAYEHLADLTPSDQAWEFLRRNPEYIAEQRRLASAGEAQDGTAPPDPSRRWGLHFRGGSRPRRPRG